MASPCTLSCQCGKLSAEISPVGTEKGNHLICYCSDCRAYAKHLAQEGRLLDEAGGTQIYQVMANQIKNLKGAEQLAFIQLTEDGVYRWYAKCCNTPVANTLATPQFPLAGIPVANLSDVDALGPVIAHVGTEEALKPVEDFGGPRVMKRTLKKVAIQKAAGLWKKTPFFDPKSSQPVTAKTELDAETIAAAYAD